MIFLIVPQYVHMQGFENWFPNTFRMEDRL